MLPSKSDIKTIRSLEMKKFRESLGMFILEGEKIVAEAGKSGIRILKTFYRNEIGDELMSRISLLSSPSPVLAIAQKPLDKPFEIPQNGKISLALESVKDPGNLGTIIRIAEWFGIDSLYLSPDCVDVYNPKVVQASMGSIFRIKTFTIDIKELVLMARKQCQVYGTFLVGNNVYSKDFTDGGLIVMGSESHGISPDVENLISTKLTIPSFSPNNSIDSLNVAVATAVICSEFRRSFGGELQTVPL
ncbi:MAG: RNA methyltransferase [Rikenellaceae bacterium]|nr:RNA methyltransferase [Rikenellaceae bacterium]